MEQALMAFWKYDQPPYCLGAEVKEFREDGRAIVEGYNGYAFMPIRIMPLEQGRIVLDKIKALGYDCDDVIRNARAHCQDEVDKLLKVKS